VGLLKVGMDRHMAVGFSRLLFATSFNWWKEGNPDCSLSAGFSRAS
jgi:hypothetical protein